MTNSTDPPRFADALAALETVVAQLESGELALEDALRAFEDGVGLVRVLNAQLGAAEERVQILMRSGGGPRLRPVEDDEL